jgi:DNA-binding NarL/FixJ family response regulator
MLLLGSHYKQTYKYFSEALEALIEVETIVQKYSSVDKMILCESLFQKGGVYYFFADYEKSNQAILQAQSMGIFSEATAELRFRSHVNVSRNYIFLKDPAKSKEHLDLAEKSWEEYQGIFDKGALYMRRQDIAISLNDWNKALAMLLEGLDFYEGTAHTLRIAEFHKELGEYYWREHNPLRDFKSSMKHFKKAVEISKEINIPRLEGALYNSMWNACKSFEEWKLCVEFMLLQSKVEESLYRSEVAVYVKKLEHLAMVEKQKMMQQGKPSFTDSMIDEVMNLREEHEMLKRSNSELQIILSDIELLIERKSQNVTGNGLFLDKLHDIIQKGKSKQPAIESYLMECDNSHPKFSRAILTVLPNITAMELKIAKLIKLGLTTQSIATLCGVAVKSIENHRIRLRKKCGLASDQSLSTFIVSIK